jgi:hypothetical protein
MDLFQNVFDGHPEQIGQLAPAHNVGAGVMLLQLGLHRMSYVFGIRRTAFITQLPEREQQSESGSGGCH